MVSDSIFGGNPIAKINNHLVRMGQYFKWAYFLGILPLIYWSVKFSRLPHLIRDKKVQFFSVWILPTVFYNIFIQFGEIGHGMSWGLGLLLILGISISTLYEDILRILDKPYQKAATCAFVLVPIISLDLFMFFYDFDKGQTDFYSFERYRQFNYQDVVKSNKFLTSKIDYIKRNLKPENSLIISSSTFSHQVMYRLPQAIVIQANIIDRKNNYGFNYFNRFRRSYYARKDDFIIPSGIDKIILFDDIFTPYFTDKQNSSYFEMGDSYKLTVCTVSPGQKIAFDYHSIWIK
ncbi:MAG: hypothetical protein Q8O36_01010 [Candidatus Omnitrophota bacterium]|nr:hypothetical protein [Candidatus Omnitrophota bacterium]